MTEWGVVGVIISLVGLFLTVGKPIIKLTSTISKLDDTCERLDEQFRDFEINNKDGHRRIWKHNEEQDDKINDHEKRITLLEEDSKNEY